LLLNECYQIINAGMMHVENGSVPLEKTGQVLLDKDVPRKKEYEKQYEIIAALSI
jgi:hypothetical protein